MSHNITANADHAIVDVKIAIIPKYSNCPDSIADGLNELLRPEVGEGVIADYALLNTDAPVQVKSDENPQEGDLFDLAPKWNNDIIQFARLLTEINATVEFSDNDFEALCESMDLEKDRIHELFNRADKLFEKAKSNL